MSLRERAAARELGKGFGLFTIGFIIFVAVVALLAQLGLPDVVSAVLFAIATLSSCLVAGIVGRTMQLPEFQVAAGLVPPAYNGMATAAVFLSSAGFLGLAALFHASGNSGLALAAGWTIGFLALAILIAPYFRRSGAATVADFLAIRYGGDGVRLAGMMITLACSLILLAAEIWAAGYLAAALLDTAVEAGIVIAVIAIVAAPVLGGMRGVTLAAIAQLIILLIAFLTPVTILSLRDYDMPLAQFTYGRALREITASASDLQATASNILPLPPLDGFNMVVLALCLAAGIASMPHIVTRSAAASGVDTARRSVGWALVFVILIMATAPAYAAFARLALLTDPGANVGADAIVLALPVIADLPPSMTALVAAGALAATLATASALLFAIGQTLGHDLYARIFDRGATAGRRLIVTRLALLASAAFAGWLALDTGSRLLPFAATSMTLAASGLFPALVLGIWWKRGTATGALAGMIAGIAVAVAYIYAVIGLGMPEWRPLGSAGSGLPAMAAGFFGLPVGLLVIIGVSHVMAEPERERQALAEAIRRPSPDPLLDHRES